MAQRFDFHLHGANATSGMLRADELSALVRSLQDTVLRIARLQFESSPTGRPPAAIIDLARLEIGLTPGSTTLTAQRASAAEKIFETAEARVLDNRFVETVNSMGMNDRPAWVGDSLAGSIDQLAGSFQQAAARVDFRVDGIELSSFRTADLDREIWLRADEASATEAEVTIEGWLGRVNFWENDITIRDDVGNTFRVRSTTNPGSLKALAGSYVTVTGVPRRGTDGKIVDFEAAHIGRGSSVTETTDLPENVSLDDILAAASGLEPGPIPGITDAEADTFFEAMGM